MISLKTRLVCKGLCSYFNVMTPSDPSYGTSSSSHNPLRDAAVFLDHNIYRANLLSFIPNEQKVCFKNSPQYMLVIILSDIAQTQSIH